MRKKTITGLIIFVLVTSAITIPMLISKLSNPDNFWSGLAINQNSNNTESRISSSYTMLNGNGYRKLLFKKGKYFFDVKIDTEKGSINVNLTTDKEGKNVFSLLEQSKEITLDKDMTLYLHISANAHKGSYAIEWHDVQQ